MSMKSISLLAATAAAVALASPVALAKEYVYGSWVSPQHGVNEALRSFFEAVEKQTDGRVTWKLLAGGQVVNARGTLPGIKDRLVDAGLVIQVFSRKELAANNVLQDMASYGVDPVAAAGASIETIMLNCPECLKEYRDNNAVFVGGYAPSNYNLICNRPIKTVAEVEDVKVRALGAQSRMVNDMGGVPVNMSPTDGVTAMQRGALDCLIGPLPWLESYGYMDVAESVVDFPLGFGRGLGLFAMNRDAWESMSVEDRKVMMRNMGGATARATINAYIKEDQRVKKLAIAKGIEFVEPGPDWQAFIKMHLAREDERIPKIAAELGFDGAKKIMETHNALYPKWEKISEEVGLDVDKYAEALWREIYSKVDVTKM